MTDTQSLAEERGLLAYGSQDRELPQALEVSAEARGEGQSVESQGGL